MAPGTPEAEQRSALLRARRWLLVDGNRLYITGALMGAFLAVLAALTAADVVAYTDDGALARMAGGMIAGTFSLVTIVLTINQLILSQQLGHVGSAREQMDEALRLRKGVEEAARIPVSPKEPTDFLHAVVHTLREMARQLRDRSADADSGDATEEIEAFADDVMHEADRMEAMLAEVEIQSLEEVLDLLEYEQAFYVYRGRGLLNTYEGRIEGDVRESFEDLMETQRLFVIAQSYFKTVYLEQELARLSRMMLYVGLPAATTAFTVGLVYAEADGAAIAERALPAVVPVLLTLVFAPLALLTAYMIRIATITQRTASAGSFVAE